MGHSFDNPKLIEDVKRVTYDVINDHSFPKIAINDTRMYYPEEISTFILKKIRNLAESKLEQIVNTAVITIPAYFGSSQREATKDAAYLAGYEVVHLINEPTAAALAYQFENKGYSKREKNIMIYDFGESTFDVSIINAKGNHCEVLAIDGDCHLGGTDIDHAIFQYVCDKLPEKLKIFTRNVKNRRRLLKACEECKKHLSTSKNYHFSTDLLAGKEDFEIQLTSRQFEKSAEHIFKRTIEVVKTCLEMAKFKTDDIDTVVMVGGSTRIPKVKQMIEELFGKGKVKYTVNPDHQVAKGAIVYASTLVCDKTEISFSDVLSLSLGTDVYGNKYSKIVERNTPIPCTKSKTYQTTLDNQSDMFIRVYEGERELASENQCLTEFSINILTRAPAGSVTVQIQFSVSSEGFLTVEAKETNTQNRECLTIDINSSRNRAKKDIQRKIDEAQKYRADDQQYIHHKEKKFSFEKYCERMEDRYEDDDSKLKIIDKIRRVVQNTTIGECDKIDLQWEKLRREME